jgi:hypothetical protein
MKALLALVLAFAVLPFSQDCAGQEPSAEPQPKEAKAKPPTGIVTGTAYCADTNLPARLARIGLVPVSGDDFRNLQFTATDLNGRFALSKVPEGRYYVAASQPGYVDPLGQLSPPRFMAMTAEDRKKLEANVPTVMVSAKLPAEVSLRLERGTEIDGTVTYDDGSPAISLEIELTPKAEKADGVEPQDEAAVSMDSFFEHNPHTSDDHGRFRILGVPPGEYLVSVKVPTSSADSSRTSGWVQLLESTRMGGLIVYTGGSLRATTAKAIKVTTGGASSDADIIIPLSKLHSIHGDVVLKSTGQPPASAFLQLVYADTQEPARVVMAPGGHFDLPFVPEESYLLRAIAAPNGLRNLGIGDDDVNEGGMIVSGFYIKAPGRSKEEGAVEIPLLVKGDVEDITIRVPDPQPLEHAAPSEAPEQGDASAPPQ